MRLLCHCDKPRDGEYLPWVEMKKKANTYLCPKCGNHIHSSYLKVYYPFINENEELLSMDIVPVKHRITIHLPEREDSP